MLPNRLNLILLPFLFQHLEGYEREPIVELWTVSAPPLSNHKPQILVLFTIIPSGNNLIERIIHIAQSSAFLDGFCCHAWLWSFPCSKNPKNLCPARRNIVPTPFHIPASSNRINHPLTPQIVEHRFPKSDHNHINALKAKRQWLRNATFVNVQFLESSLDCICPMTCSNVHNNQS